MHAELSDPILELTTALRKLRFSADERGYKALAKKFGVDPSSSEFALIIHLIIKRIESVSRLVNDMDEVDDIVKQRQLTCLANIKEAFSPVTLANNWKTNGGGPGMLAEENLSGVEALQSHARKLQPTPKLSEEELKQLLHRVVEFRQQLEDLQKTDRDFIRQSLVDGIVNFELSLKHFKWLGWDNAYKSFEQAFLLYLIEEHGIDPSKEAGTKLNDILKGARDCFRHFWEIARRAKEQKEVADFILETFSSGTNLLNGSP